LQVLQASSIIATGGLSYKPHLLYAKEADRQLLLNPLGEPDKRKLDPEILAFIRDAMRTAVSAGTCRQLDIAGLQICAKSGTAEVKGKADHSWVTGFYPKDKPRYCFVVLVEHGGSSGEAAIPLMREVLLYMKSNDPLADDKLLASR
jgi:penicillin-binding protein 2